MAIQLTRTYSAAVYLSCRPPICPSCPPHDMCPFKLKIAQRLFLLWKTFTLFLVFWQISALFLFSGRSDGGTARPVKTTEPPRSASLTGSPGTKTSRYQDQASRDNVTWPAGCLERCFSAATGVTSGGKQSALAPHHRYARAAEYSATGCCSALTSPAGFTRGSSASRLINDHENDRRPTIQSYLRRTQTTACS